MSFRSCKSRVQAVEKEDLATIGEIKTAIIEVLRHHDVPLEYDCIVSNIEGSTDIYPAFCELFHEGKIERLWENNKGQLRKVFKLKNDLQ